MKLSADKLIDEARIFCEIENRKDHSKLYGISDGKAIGTYVEHSFKEYLRQSYEFEEGSSASGVDFSGELNTDIKVTSTKKPQNSCPFNNIEEKIYGLSYNILLFIYEKEDVDNTCNFRIKSCTFIKKSQTGDYNITKNLRQMTKNAWTQKEIKEYLTECSIPGDEDSLEKLAAKVINNPPQQGYLTISNALQWRIKYNHIKQLDKTQHTRDITKKEYGDYQTPLFFTEDVLEYVTDKFEINPDVVIEPTCGIGNFLKTSRTYYPECRLIGIDINQTYLEKVENDLEDVELYNENIFEFDFEEIMGEDEEYLLIGNPPWASNTNLAKINSDNLPRKKNLKNLDFFSSQTGMANFDISENLLLHLIEKFRKYRTTMIFLCKYSVACNVFEYIIKKEYYPYNINIIKFNARKIFHIDETACILVMQYRKNNGEISTCTVNDMNDEDVEYEIGIINDKLYSNINTNNKDIEGKCQFEWRQGIKHDCTNVMELEKIEDSYYNKQDEEVEIEDDILYTLLKSSNLKKPVITDSTKRVIITQHELREDTSHIREDYPLAWKYLENNREAFENRKSKIYKNKPDYSIFGIGDYAFQKYKVSISGFYKKGLFTLTYNEEKPVMLDDTCYYLSFDDYDHAYTTMLILNSKVVKRFLKSIVFLDSKRPYTKKVLKRIDIQKALAYIDINDLKETEKLLELDGYITEEKLDDYRKYLNNCI